MRIEDLDEFEGLTAEMVREWLRAQAPRIRMESGGIWEWANSGAEMLDMYMEALLPHRAEQVARNEKRSLQSLLREINPRMRKGWPTEEEIARHDWWMVRTPFNGGIQVLSQHMFREWKKAGLFDVECWPCDEHGNKVRRGA